MMCPPHSGSTSAPSSPNFRSAALRAHHCRQACATPPIVTPASNQAGLRNSGRVPFELAVSSSERLQILDQIAALRVGQTQVQQPLVMSDDRVQVGETTIVVVAAFRAGK